MRKINTLIFSLFLCLCLASCRELTSSDLSSTVSSLSSVVVSNSSDASDESTSELQAETPSTTSEEAPSTAMPCKHSYSVTNVTATCTDNGFTIYTCSKCNASYKEAAPATGHDYKYTETAATCIAQGSRIGVCQKCGLQTSKEALPATGHSFSGVSCTKCGIKDTDTARNMLYGWFKDNSVFDTQENGQRYHLPSDGNYSLWANEYKNCSFFYSNGDTFICISVYGFEKNKCYLEFKKGGGLLEGEFPMDSLHSSVRIYFNEMNGDKSLIPVLQNEIDGFLLKFENEVLKPQVNITLADLGFTSY